MVPTPTITRPSNWPPSSRLTAPNKTDIHTGLSLKKVITTLRPLREFVGEIDGHELVFPPDVPPQAAELISNVENFGPGPGH